LGELCDAIYLEPAIRRELAIRRRLPLASSDTALRRGAGRRGVTVALSGALSGRHTGALSGRHTGALSGRHTGWAMLKTEAATKPFAAILAPRCFASTGPLADYPMAS
jgi:hypothetical protein